MKHFDLLWSLLDKGQRLYFFYMVFLMLIQAMLEVLSIALIIPFTALILNPREESYNLHVEVEESLSIEEKEKELISKALTKYKGRRKQAAGELGISERTLYRKIKEYDLK